MAARAWAMLSSERADLLSSHRRAYVAPDNGWLSGGRIYFQKKFTGGPHASVQGLRPRARVGDWPGPEVRTPKRWRRDWNAHHILNSTRRFFARPSIVPLSAIGLEAP